MPGRTKALVLTISLALSFVFLSVLLFQAPMVAIGADQLLALLGRKPSVSSACSVASTTGSTSTASSASGADGSVATS